MLDLLVKDGVAWVTLQRPEVLNAINRELADAFRLCIEELQNRVDVRVLVTRGAGKAFCSGSDLRELAPLSAAEAAAYELQFAETFARLDELPQPTIAMVHGYALGGGLGLALYHDFRIAAVTASLGMPEVELGWIPPWAVGRLAEAVGVAQARWLLMSCQIVSGTQAADIGLLNEAVAEDQLLPRVEQFATRLASMPAEGLISTKAFLNRISALRKIDYDRRASESFRDCFAKPGAQERLRHFAARKTRR
jgi:enoyl-CoA hydratase/carnithine racemase